MKSPTTAWMLAAAVLSIGSFPRPLHAMSQTNPAKQAPALLNNSAAGYSNEYPWLSDDGRLLLWTRQHKGTPIQRVWVTFIKNRDQVAGTPSDGRDLPSLDLATPWSLSPVNTWADDEHPGETIKAIAVCEEEDSEDEQPADLGNRWRYRFSLFMAVGPASGGKKLYRAHRVFVVVDKASGEITSTGISAGVLAVTGTDVEGKNETEPMLTRDGRYLFWASSAFNGTVARFIGPVSPCSQLAQVSKPYDQLPAGDFAWKDQYTTGPVRDRLSSTNYHTVVERPDGDTALIFEKCHGQVTCESDPMSVDCDCQPQNKRLSSTGFTAGGEPTEIESCCSQPLHGSWRVSHPAIAGPRQPDGSWLLFYMRGKKIWYTKIEE